MQQDLASLISRLKSIDESEQILQSDTTDAAIEECGDNPNHEQPNNVTMNVTMSGQGAGGIADLMKILRNIEDGEAHGAEPDGAIIVGEPHGGEIEEPIMGDSVEDDTFKNSMKGSAGPVKGGIDDVVFTGDDLAGNTAPEPHKKQGGGNPYPMNEELVSNLYKLYDKVKNRNLNEGCMEDPHKHALAHILMADKHGHRQMMDTGTAPHDLYEKLYDYYFDDMPTAIKKHPDHQVRHDHIVARCKQDLMTPECQYAMEQYGNKPAPMAPTMQ